MVQRVFCVLCFFVMGTYAAVWECELPDLFKECYNFYSRVAKVHTTPAYGIHSRCINSYLWKTSSSRYHLQLSHDNINYIKSLQREMNMKRRMNRYTRYKRQAAAPPAVRREIRTLSDTERQAFFDAVNTLKNDGSYDALANMHMGIVIDSGHEGPAFLGWHREYLVAFETALRRVNPSVSLPYWDSTLDFVMGEPVETSFFSSALVGNGDGIVVNGPFSDWPARPDGQRLERDIATIGSLFTPEGLDLLLNDPNINRTSQIVLGTGVDLASTLEGQHNNVHNWVGGTMSGLETAAHDPVFFMFHAHVDYIWERFRGKQVALGSANPETDYPVINNTLHLPGVTMEGFPELTNLDGYRDSYTTDIYTYANTPECANGCGGSPFLRCDQSINRCVALTAAEVGATGNTNQNPPIDFGDFQFLNTFSDPRTRLARSTRHTRNKRDNQYIQRLLSQTANLSKKEIPSTNLLEFSYENKITKVRVPKSGSQKLRIESSTPVMERGRQNLFSMDGVADIRRWAYIPVKIVNKRDVSRHAFKSPLVVRGHYIPGADPYHPLIYSALRPFFSVYRQKVATFPTCKAMNSGIKKVYIRSDGLNYAGKFIDYGVVDERQPMSETTAYVAVKHPNLGQGKAIITAYDSSGKVCEPKCLVPGSFPPSYRSCAGVINISNHLPKMYADDYGEAVKSQWNFVSDDCPSQQSSPVPLIFYCAPTVQWPWKNCLHG